MPGARLTLAERSVIERGIEAGLSQVKIAAVLGRDPSTVSREVRRGGGAVLARHPRPGGRPRCYRAGRAHRWAARRARRPKPFRLTGALAAVVTGLLEADWSPQQVAAMLPLLYPQDEAGRVSHETIYRSLFVQGRGELRRELGSTPANSTELVGAPLTRTLITEEGPVSDRRARK